MEKDYIVITNLEISEVNEELKIPLDIAKEAWDRIVEEMATGLAREMDVVFIKQAIKEKIERELRNE